MSNNPHQNHQIQQNMQMGSGLTRYRSAPSSYFATLLSSPTSGGGEFGTDDLEQLFNQPASSPETQRIFSGFMNRNTDTIPGNCTSNLPPPVPLPPQSQMNSQLLSPSKAEPEVRQSQSRPPLQRQQSNDYSSSAQMIFQAHSVPQENTYEKSAVPPPVRPPLQRQMSNDYSSAASAQMMYQSHTGSQDNSYDKLWGSFKSNRVEQMKMEGGAGENSGLIRHSSSPAGLFADINIDEFLPLRGIGSFGAGNSSKTEAHFSSSATRFKTEMSSSSSILDPLSLSEMGNKSIGKNDHNFSWDDSMMLPDSFLSDLADSESPRFSNANSSNDQIKGGGKRPAGLLSHHLSLPKNITDLSAVEKLLQDSVPCKIRAKRGFATHPRSIAERVRRTKISERMRKLQELVPNMEKQTNTSDMLDLAVDYIKDLQKEVKTLSDNRATCTCLAKQVT